MEGTWSDVGSRSDVGCYGPAFENRAGGGLFMFGLSLTSPINASIITTGSPIITMIVAALFLHEPVTKSKLLGVFLGAIGAFVLIVSGQHGDSPGGNIWGDILCLLAQLSFALYLVFYKGLTSRYSSVTLMKWMFTYSFICLIPFSYREMVSADWEALSGEVLWGLISIVFLLHLSVICLFRSGKGIYALR